MPEPLCEAIKNIRRQVEADTEGKWSARSVLVEVEQALSSLTPSPVGELVDVTQPIDDIYVRDGFCDWADVANARDEVRNLHATSLTSLSAEVARLRMALEPFADIADLIDSETEGMSETDELALHFHDYLMASWPVALFRAARRVREGEKVE